MTFRGTQLHGNVDALSRLPVVQEVVEPTEPPELVLLLEHFDDSPVTARQIEQWTRRDPSLVPVLHALQHGWKEGVGSELAPFYSRRNELSLWNGCILWGSRVVIPQRGRKAVLEELHVGHMGMSKMKGLARMYMWWPGMDRDIEQLVQNCENCQLVQAMPPTAPLQPWSWPSRPWSRLHLDFAGPVEGKMLLILIDAHSKWIEVFVTSSSTSAIVIEELRSTFGRFGLPEVIVTDNGTCFRSSEFETFLRRNGVKHITSAPYHPSSNGLAERAMRVIKQGLRKVTEGTLKARIATILTSYRITPQATTGVPPSELLFGRRIRTRLDLLKPNIASHVENSQMVQKRTHDIHSKSRTFGIGEKVYVRNFGQGQLWLPGVVTKVTGPVSFLIRMQRGELKRCHQDQLRQRHHKTTERLEDENVQVSPSRFRREPENEIPEPDTTHDCLQPVAEPENPLLTQGRLMRNRKPPDRFEPTF